MIPANTAKEEAIMTMISGMFALLLLGLVYTQVLNYETYFTQSQRNFIRVLPIDGPRGRIFDRNGRILVNNRISFDVSCVYQEIGPKDAFIKTVSGILGVPARQIIKALNRASESSLSAPVVICEDIDSKKAIALEELESDLQGLMVENRSKRDYILADSGAHIFGYLGEINEEELERLKDYGYRMRSLIGRSGVEKYFNNYLTGIDGGEQIEVDSKGRRVNVLGLKEPVAGKDIWLTVDTRLQLLADKLLANKTGAIRVMDVHDGALLAMASRPSYDPNIFIDPDGGGERLRLLRSPSKPLVNRALGGLYPPGSIFKIVVACAGLETKRISRSTRFVCPGRFSLGSAVFHCWKELGHGSQDIVEAIKNSCNVFFYNTGRALGVDTIESYAVKLGFGRPAGIELQEESAGLVPGRLWKMIALKDAWYEGETVNYAIGQGYLLVTPIQIIRMTAAVANGGRLVRPYIVKRIGAVDVSGMRFQDTGISQETLRIVREGMKRSVQDDSGTGRRARVEGLSIGAKTGTAQNPKGAPHAWFTGFAPWDDPKIAIVIIIEHGGKGGIGPADMAHQIFAEVKDAGLV